MDVLFTFIGLFVGRSSRRAFWIVSAMLFVARMAVTLTNGNELIAGTLLTIPWFWIWWRRLHDINLSGKWSFVPVTLGFGVGFIDGWNRAARENAQAEVTLTSLPANWFELALQHPDAFLGGAWSGFINTQASEFAAHPVTMTVSWAMTLALALWPGTPGPNRFGPPPGRGRTPPD